MAPPVLANGQIVFVYSKTVIKIIPGHTTPRLESNTGKDASQKKDGADAVNMMPELQRAPKEYKVEVRAPSFLETKDLILHQPFADKEGMLILINPPAETELKATRMINSADVMFVDSDGYIIKIAPSLDLTNLSETIGSGKPIHAFVFLKSGTCSSDDIQIGDRIENDAFKTHPTIIQ
jgi:uncharacterized membrane protein (UPF0127 family)